MGTVPCTNQVMTSGTLTTAEYTNTYAYDTLDRLTSGQVGDYTYGDAAHLHAVTSIGVGGTTNYSASYDALGDMTCRAATNATTCAGGTPTGNVLTYDNEGRLATWQTTPSSPTTTASYLYDGEGNRVEQKVTTSGATTSTVYVAGGSEEVTTNSGGTTTLTKYFVGAAGLPTAERVGTNGPLSYLATDGQGTVSETLDASGNATFQALYGPYGTVRYTSGTSPTSRGYTGQRADAATGLDYYQARYYDPVAGQFISADSVADGLNRYGYVGGNPTTKTDPTGHSICDPIAGDNCSHGDGKDHKKKKHKSDNSTDGVVTVPTSDPCAKPQSQACRDIKEKAWRYDNEQARQSHLFGKLLLAAGLILGGELAILAGDMEIVETTKIPLDGLWAINDALSSIALNIGDFFSYVLPQNSPLRSLVDTAMAGINAIEAFVHSFEGALAGGGFMILALWNLGKMGVNFLLGTEFEVSFQLAGLFLGSALGHLLGAAGHALAAEGWAVMADYDGQMSMDIGEWCSQNAAVCTKKSDYGL